MLADVAAALERDVGLQAAGFNLFGALTREGYDALAIGPWQSDNLLPGARTAVILGTGGRALGAALSVAPEAGGPDPVDRFTERVVRGALQRLATAGVAAHASFYWEQRKGRFLDFVALGERVGLGVRSRLGVLLAAEYGPWFALRAVVLCAADARVTRPVPGFEPCTGCAAPCALACPARAFGPADRLGPLDPAMCAAARLDPDGCSSACASRRACVVGTQHAYTATIEAHHMASVATALRVQADD